MRHDQRGSVGYASNRTVCRREAPLWFVVGTVDDLSPGTIPSSKRTLKSGRFIAYRRAFGSLVSVRSESNQRQSRSYVRQTLRLRALSLENARLHDDDCKSLRDKSINVSTSNAAERFFAALSSKVTRGARSKYSLVYERRLAVNANGDLIRVRFFRLSK